MRHAADTNVLARWLQPDDPQNAVAEAAVRQLLREGHTVEIVPQSLHELWVVATRRKDVKGWGEEPAGFAAEVA